MPPLTRRTNDPLEVRIYHICLFANLASVLQSGEFCSTNVLGQRGIVPVSIAYGHLQQRRRELNVPCAPAGTLHDYVPWSFSARSPMLCAIANGKVESSVSQDQILHLVSDVGRVQAAKLTFVFTDGHPLTSVFTRYSNDLSQLISFLDWPVLLDLWWNNTAADSDRSRRRQAEFLIHRAAPWEIVRGIAVQTPEMKHRVEQLVQNYRHQPKIQVLPEWYY